MSEVVNLRRVRKEKARTEKEKTAAANRTKHGVAKNVRELNKAMAEKEIHNIDSKKLDE